MPTSTSLDIVTVRILMTEVEIETLQSDPDDLESNPVVHAVREIYQRLKEAVELVADEGQDAMKQALESIVAEWRLQKAAVGDQAHLVLALFQEQVQSLTARAMSIIAASFPADLKGGRAAGTLESVAFKTAVALSPSVAASATEWLKLAANGGFEVTATYKFTPGATIVTQDPPPA